MLCEKGSITSNTDREERLKASRERLARTRNRAPEYRMECRYGADRARLETPVEGAADLDSVPWTNELRVLFCGTRDFNSPLSLLRGHEETILKLIVNEVAQSYRANVQITPPAHTVGRIRDPDGEIIDCQSPPDDIENFVWRPRHHTAIPMRHFLMRNENCRDYQVVDKPPRIAFSRCGTVKFPEPADRNVNMLPFIMGDKESLPIFLQPYYDSVISICPIDEAEVGEVVYLTVSECYVPAGKSQRRGGLHIETPGVFNRSASFLAAWEHHWGLGDAFSPDYLEGGIFFASNMKNTSQVWDALVTPTPGIVDKHGGIEQLRHFIGKGTKLRANELVWMTDRTPHEVIPQESGGYRQFFRLVTSQISIWFDDHSTPNPKVDLPDNVKVVYGSKFESQMMPVSTSHVVK